MYTAFKENTVSRPLEMADNVAGVMAATSAQGDATTSKIIAR